MYTECRPSSALSPPTAAGNGTSTVLLHIQNTSPMTNVPTSARQPIGWRNVRVVGLSAGWPTIVVNWPTEALRHSPAQHRTVRSETDDGSADHRPHGVPGLRRRRRGVRAGHAGGGVHHEARDHDV